MAMTEAMLRIERITKNLGSVPVLRGIDAEVQRGSVTAFVGPNGAGKTTLFHTISGDLRPDAGTVRFRGELISQSRAWAVARRGIGKLFQDVRVFEGLSILENVLIALYTPRERALAAAFGIGRAPSTNVSRRADTLLKDVGVQPPYDRPARVLSYGNKKLLAITRLIAGGFDLYLLDEPVAGLSPAMVQRMDEIIRRLCSEGATVAIIEHNISFVTDVANYVYLLREGQVHDHGSAREVLDRQSNKEILVGL